MSTATDTSASNQTSRAANLRVYNTLSGEKEPFTTIQPGKVGIYLCGPTVYKEAHIGHMVGPIIFDCIKRYLTYCGYEVTWVVNITDVDDKLIAESRRRGISMAQIAIEMTMDYCANLLAIGVDQITHMPRATENMDEIRDFIADLIEKQFAYEVDGDVFFDVAKDRGYGKLSNRRPDQQQGEGGEAAAKKRSASDFALWKSAKPGEPAWDSPWGQGRPGWHIECSAMSRRILGETFDIHGGGLDLVFPHHENEVAQSECCHGKPMARYWMHNGLMRAAAAGKLGGRADREQSRAGEESGQASNQTAETDDKISRSKGAGGLRGLIARQGGERIRFFLMRTHYRSTIEFSEQGIEEAGAALEKFYLFFERYERITNQSFYLDPDSELESRRLIARRDAGELAAGDSGLLAEAGSMRQSFLDKMDDDFNSGAAVSELFQLLTALNKFADEKQLEDAAARDDKNVIDFLRACETLRELAAVLGMFLKPPAQSGDSSDQQQLVEGLMRLLIDLRASARGNKDFATADRIRDALAELNVTIEDRKDGTGWRMG